MASVKSETLTKRISVSVTAQDRALFDLLCKKEGRNGREQVMWMIRQRANAVLNK